MQVLATCNPFVHQLPYRCDVICRQAYIKDEFFSSDSKSFDFFLEYSTLHYMHMRLYTYLYWYKLVTTQAWSMETNMSEF